MARLDVDWLREGGFQEPVLIICYLRRVADPLKALVKELFRDSEVQVKILDSIRGLTAQITYIVRRRRFVGELDQFSGIQADARREYIAYTRGRLKTVVFLEGANGYSTATQKPQDAWNQVARARDDLLWHDWRRGYFGDVFSLRESQHGWRADFCSCFSKEVPPELESQVREAVEKALRGVARSAARQRESPSFHGALGALLQLAGNSCRFCTESVNDLSAPGVGKAAASFRVAQEEPAAPQVFNREEIGQALIFGSIIVPSVVSQLSNKSCGGVTHMCIPVLSLEPLAPLGAALADDSHGAEPMLSGLFVLCFHLVKELLGNVENTRTIIAASLRHKAEVKEVLGEVWFRKACPSDRVAACLLNTAARKAGQQKRLYMYRGGGQLDFNASSLASSIVVICKNKARREDRPRPFLPSIPSPAFPP